MTGRPGEQSPDASKAGHLWMYACQPGDNRLAFKHRSAGSRHDMVMVVEVVRMTTRGSNGSGSGRDRQRPSYRDLISQQPTSPA